MNRFNFLRKPLKLILITALAALMSTAALVFCVQAYMDTLTMDHAMRSTAYVGSLYSRLQKYPMLKDIPDDLLKQLEDSEFVDAVMVAPVYSAKVEGVERVADGFGINESMNMKLFLEGTVSGIPALSPSGYGTWEQFTLKITRNWAGLWPGDEILVNVLRDPMTNAPMFREGEHVFLVGRYNSSLAGDVTGMILCAPDILDVMNLDSDSAIWNHAILKLEDGLSAEESAAAIEAFLRESGLEAPFALMEQIQDVFTVHEVADMSMLLTVADGTTFITKGRELNAGDSGKRVCVINDAVAKRNGLDVGDTICISLAESCYTYDDFDEAYRGWKSGYPFERDRLMEYGDPLDFEIVGISSEVGRKVGGLDFNHFSRNDIFIPKGILPAYTGRAQSRAVTYRVLGPDYEKFMDRFEVSLNDAGYSLSLIDCGWETMSSGFYAVGARRILMVACAVAAFLAAVLSYSVLLSNHFRYEYALRRLLGAMPGEAREVYRSAFSVTAIPACLAALLCSFGVYLLWLKGQLSASVPGAMPSDGAILAYLGTWALAELGAALVLLMILARVTNRQSLIKLLK